ncbi:MAG: hypothetical protein IT577_24485, partial [Verrucomicrobiae bacterium]|nr:hypothetical protein [Verrucomicrobiae bacterium]
LAAVAIPSCCCNAEAWGAASRPTAAHACCGDATADDHAPASPDCDCGCSQDLFPQKSPVTTADGPAFEPEWARMAAPFIAAQPHPGRGIASHGLACHDPPGFGTHRFLILRHLRC